MLMQVRIGSPLIELTSLILVGGEQSSWRIASS
jgi:hypothetical protein